MPIQNSSSSTIITFRIKDYQLARLIRALLTISPSQPITSLSDAVKTTVLDWTAKHSTSLSASPLDLSAIQTLKTLPSSSIEPYTTVKAAFNNTTTPNHHLNQSTTNLTSAQLRDLAEEQYFNELKAESLQAPPNNQKNCHLVPPSQNPPSNDHQTSSTISTVTDFSPPPEWLEAITK